MWRSPPELRARNAELYGFLLSLSRCLLGCTLFHTLE